jgi:hypothetical protein
MENTQNTQNTQTTWDVKTNEGNVQLNSATLLDALLGKVIQTPKQDFDELILEFTRFLQSRQLFGEMKFNQLAGMSFATGYFYRVFLEKNDVNITVTDMSNNAANTESDITNEQNVGENIDAVLDQETISNTDSQNDNSTSS